MSISEAVNAIAEVAQAEARDETNPDAVEQPVVEQAKGQDPGEQPDDDDALGRLELLEKLRGARKQNEQFRKRWQPASEALESLGEENAQAVLGFAKMIAEDPMAAARWALDNARVLAGDQFNALAEELGIPMRVDPDKPAGEAPEAAKPAAKPKVDDDGEELVTRAEARAEFMRLLEEREKARAEQDAIASRRQGIVAAVRELGYVENDPLLPTLLQIAGTKLGATDAERIKAADADLKKMLEARGLEVVKAKAADAAGIAGAPDGAAPAGRNLSVSAEEAMEARMDRVFGPRRHGLNT